MSKKDSGKRATMTIRVTQKTNNALNMVVSKLKASNPGKRITQDDVIWALISKQENEIATLVERAMAVIQPSDN